MEELKEMNLNAMFDKTFRISFGCIRKNIKFFLLYFGASIGISIILLAVLGISIFSLYRNDIMELSDSRDLLPIMAGLSPFFLIFFVIMIIFYVFYSGFVSDMAIKAFLSQEWKFTKSFQLIKKKFFPIFFTSILAGLFSALGILACGIGIIFLSTFVCLIIPIILYENLHYGKTIQRSFQLVGKNYWSIFGHILLMGIIIQAASFVFQLFMPFFINIFQTTLSSVEAIIPLVLILILMYIVLIIYGFIAYVLQITLIVLLFFNQKIKHENFGVEILAESVIAEEIDQ